MNIHDFKKMKIENRKISMITAYDYCSAKTIAESKIDCILVGDSAAMVVHGYDSTINATTEMISIHTLAVRKGAPQKFITSDMPFLTFRKSIEEAVNAAGILLKAGANAVKIEGLDGHETIIKHLIESGIPVMAHIGLTPQFVQQIGGYKVQGKNLEAKNHLKYQAKKLEDLGCFALVLECVPKDLAVELRDLLSIPVIGIGAGVDVDGQVLVYHDLIGLSSTPKPRFVRTFLNGHQAIFNALNEFHEEIIHATFPNDSETYK